MIVFKNEYFCITQKDEKLYIETLSSGFSIQDFQLIIEKFPRISITQFLALKQALEQPSNQQIEFGSLKPKFDLFITSDNLEAKIYINLSKQELDSSKAEIISEILALLEKNKIKYGILYDEINKNLEVKKYIVIAKGKLPIKGKDAVVKYIDLPQMKPSINEDGSTDYYEMNLFKYVAMGEWLGEKILAQPGEPGMNIKAEVLPAASGKDESIRYDTTTIELIAQGEKEIIIAKIDGAVQIKEGKIGVAEHLFLDGNVGYETGNIEFSGYVTIQGTVEDSFSVIAGKDISILSDIGLGAVDKIISRQGNIYIKGGISGKGKTVIEAGKSVFTKYVNSCVVKAGDSINVGYYTLDSHLEASNISVQAKNGKTIGGSILAKHKVALRTVGNIYEKQTNIQVDGFDRKAYKAQMDELLIKYKQLLQQAEQMDRELELFESMFVKTENIKDTKDYIIQHKNYENLKDKLYILEEERQNMIKVLASKGEGEVSIYEKAYPQTFLQIKNIQKRINSITSGTFYAIDNKLMFD